MDDLIYKYIAHKFGEVVHIELVDCQPLQGGHVSSEVQLLKIRVVLEDGVTSYFSMVKKRTWSNETLAMSALQQVSAAATALPEMIAYGEDAEGEWCITP